MGVLIRRALLFFGVYITAPDVWKESISEPLMFGNSQVETLGVRWAVQRLAISSLGCEVQNHSRAGYRLQR